MPILRNKVTTSLWFLHLIFYHLLVIVGFYCYGYVTFRLIEWPIMCWCALEKLITHAELIEWSLKLCTFLKFFKSKKTRRTFYIFWIVAHVCRTLVRIRVLLLIQLPQSLPLVVSATYIRSLSYRISNKHPSQVTNKFVYNYIDNPRCPACAAGHKKTGVYIDIFSANVSSASCFAEVISDFFMI